MTSTHTDRNRPKPAALAAATLALLTLSAQSARADMGQFIVRFNSANGSIDTSYGFAGATLSNPAGNNDGTGIGVFPFFDKIVSVGNMQSGAAFGLVGRTNNNGSADPSFGFLGISAFDFPASSNDNAIALDFQPNPKIVVAGNAFFGGNQAFIAARYNWNGSLDTTFGVNGYAEVFFGSGLLMAMKVDPNNRIVLAGSMNSHVALARLTPNGQLDTTFGNGGTVLEKFGNPPFSEAAHAIAFDGDKIVIAGHATNPNTNMGVMRFHSNGQLDTSYGSGGRVIIDYAGTTNESAFGISCLPPNQGCIVVGTTNSLGTGLFAVTRLTSTGQIHSTFGKRTTSFAGAGETRALDVHFQADGKALVAGHAIVNGQGRIALARLTGTGPLDTTFGSGGKVLQAVGTHDIEVTDMAIDVQANRFLIIGRTN